MTKAISWVTRISGCNTLLQGKRHPSEREHLQGTFMQAREDPVCSHFPAPSSWKRVTPYPEARWQPRHPLFPSFAARLVGSMGSQDGLLPATARLPFWLSTKTWGLGRTWFLQKWDMLRSGSVVSGPDLGHPIMLCEFFWLTLTDGCLHCAQFAISPNKLGDLLCAGCFPDFLQYPLLAMNF